MSNPVVAEAQGRSMHADNESQTHLLSIRRALANRSASVMVGAGFSRNAEGGGNLATWRELSEALASELNPSGPADFSPALTAQLAEQYSRAFSPGHLEQLIKRHIPDDQVAPGALHSALLELPWSEVFTTNYDTLLERAAERLFDAPYFTVRSREDIPQSKALNRRRIVKLHGSFPSHRPFILTEEDYRTYPVEFAPFVNLVRHSLLENVFCLIGFSGEDPNFLQWLGWVRDMLTRYALPIYLFLGSEPSFGERKLYEARGVVPVVLPLGTDGDPQNYASRYRQLLQVLKEPLNDSPLSWGNCPLLSEPQVKEDRDAEFESVLARAPRVQDYRRTYPGWLIPPATVRSRFRWSARNFEQQISQPWFLERLQGLGPQVAVAILELYCWMQQVALGPLDDTTAGAALQILDNPDIHRFPEKGTRGHETLLRHGINDSGSLRRVVNDVALAILRWARQAHRVKSYEQLRSRLVLEPDSTLQDALKYEEVLRILQHGNEKLARKTAAAWKVEGTDVYMHVLRASVLAECGATSEAISACESALRTLRLQQRSRPADQVLLSKEAWACQVAVHIERAVSFQARMNPGTGADGDSASDMREDFARRLEALGARGYSAQNELAAVQAELNAEVGGTSAERQRTTEFDLWATREITRHGSASELQDKIAASFAWLELSERTGLMPRIVNHVVFYGTEMLQAAWWIRYADRIERSIGLLVRARDKSSLNAKDDSKPSYRTGWLSRYLVATLSEETVTSLAGELVQILWLEFSAFEPDTSRASRVEFLAEVFSRLAIRVRDVKVVVGWGRQLLTLHGSLSLQSEIGAWLPIGSALARLIEALPPKQQAKLLFDAFQVPVFPAKNAQEHMRRSWLNLIELAGACDISPGSDEALDWGLLLQDHLHRLAASHAAEPVDLLWDRVEALREAKVLTKAQLAEVGNWIWRDVPDGGWPTLFKNDPVRVLNWPSNANSVYAKVLARTLGRPLRPFAGGYMQLTPAHGRRSYGIGGSPNLLIGLLICLREVRISADLRGKLVDWIEEWLNAEQADLCQDMVGSSEIARELERIVGRIDEVLALCVKSGGLKPGSRVATAFYGRVAALDQRLGELSPARASAGLALLTVGFFGPARLDETVSSIVAAICADVAESEKPFRAAYAMLNDSGTELREPLSPLFDAVVAAVYLRKLPALLRALDILSGLDARAWEMWLTPASSALLEAALEGLRSALAYDSSAQRRTTLPEELFPLLRYKTVRLADRLLRVARVQSRAAESWIADARSDPLPELRLGRYV